MLLVLKIKSVFEVKIIHLNLLSKPQLLMGIKGLFLVSLVTFLEVTHQKKKKVIS